MPITPPIADLGFAPYRRTLDARRGRLAGEAACRRSLDAVLSGVNAAQGLPAPAPLGPLTAR